MRSNRKKNWLIRRIALGIAVAAFIAPVAQAKVDETSSSNAGSYKPFVTDFPSVTPDLTASNQIELVRAAPRVTPTDQIEVVRVQPRGTSSDKIEFVRLQPRSIGEPQVVTAGFNWDDAAVGAGLALGLVLLAGAAAVSTRRLGRAQTA
jgi:hypothetical protein